MCPSGRSVVCHVSRRLGRRTPKRTDCRLNPSSPGRWTGWDEVTVFLSHRSHSRVVNELSCHQHTTPHEPLASPAGWTSLQTNFSRLQHDVCRPNNVRRLDNVYHQSSYFDVQIVKRSICRRFWRPNRKTNSSKLLWYYDVLSLSHVQQVFWRPRFYYRSADDSIMRQSHDDHTGHKPAGATVPVHWTWTSLRLYTQKVYRKTLWLLMKHETSK